MRSTFHTAQRCVATLATAGLMVAGFAAPAFAASNPSPTLVQTVSRAMNTTGVYTVAPNHQLLELGYASGKAAGQTTYAYPTSLLRVGTKLKGFEVQVAGPSFYHTVPGTAGVSAQQTDTGVGAKYLISSGSRYAQSLQYFMNLPTGDNSGTTSGYNSTYSYQGRYQINSTFAAAAHLAFTSNVGTGTTGTIRYGSFDPSLVVTAALPYELNGFVEGSAYSRQYGKGTSAMQYRAGVLRSLSPNVVADAEFGVRNDKATGSPSSISHVFGIGLSFYH